MHIVLGVNHPFSTNLSQFLRDFVDRESNLFWYQPVSPGYKLCMPILIVHWIMLRTDHWFRSQGVSDIAIPPPNFGELFTDIDLGKHWEPVLPTDLIAHMRPPPAQNPILPRSQPRVPTPSPAPTPTPTQQGGGEPTGGQPTDRNPLPNRMVMNPAYKENLFLQFKQLNINHAALRNRVSTRPPASPHGTRGEMCLSYHVKGICNCRCGRAEDHQPHTEEQDQLLLDWCTAHYRAAV